MKRLIVFFLMVLLVSVNAFAETEGDYIYKIQDDGTVCITEYTGDAVKVVVPDLEWLLLCVPA